MEEGYPLWRELERVSGEKILHEVGLLYFGPQDSPNLKSTIEGLRDLQVPYEVVSGSNAQDIFPQLSIERDEIGVFTPDAGWVDAKKALAATWSLAESAGARMVTRSFRVDDFKRFEKIVVCPGAWVRYWWPRAPIKVTLQTTAYVEGDVSGPVWIEDGPNLMYGFPSEGRGFKVGVHRQGPVVDPYSWDREPSEESLSLIKEIAQRRFGVQEPSLQRQTGCLYTNTQNEDFLLRQINDRTILASACSGHGFKFGPWLGRLLADVVEGKQSFRDYPRFYCA
jgi:glycine/D-amino acid oxidase-like deaminating enzyme